MTQCYRHLQYDERCQIRALHQQGVSISPVKPRSAPAAERMLRMVAFAARAADIPSRHAISKLPLALDFRAHQSLHSAGATIPSLLGPEWGRMIVHQNKQARTLGRERLL